jgi:PKD repeat protein
MDTLRKNLVLLSAAPLLLSLAFSCGKNGSVGNTHAQPAPSAPAFTVRVAASGLANPTQLAAAGDGTLVLAQQPAAPQDATLARLDLTTGALTLVGAGQTAAAGFAVNQGGRIYWIDAAKGALMTQDGQSGAPTVLHSGGILPATTLAVDGSDRVYIAGAAPSFAGSDVAAVFVRGNAPSMIPDPLGPAKTALAAASTGDLYWTSSEDGVIYHRSADGTGQVLVSGLKKPQAITLAPAEDVLYFTELPTPGVAGDAGGANTVNALDLATLQRTVIHQGDPQPAGVAVTPNGNIYWTSSSRGLLLQAVPPRAAVTTPQFTAMLTGAQEVPPVTTKAAGQVTFSLSPAKTSNSHEEGDDQFSRAASLLYNVSITGIQRVRRVEIHQGAPGAVGPLVATLSRGDDDSEDGGGRTSATAAVVGFSFSGRLRSSSLRGPLAGNWQGFTDALAAGGLYVNVTTRANPTGEIRGQILPPVTTANHPPVGTITSPAGDVTIAAGGSVSFAGTATDPDSDAVTVLWAFGDGTTSSALAPGAHTYPVAGTYTVTFTATDAKGLSDPAPPTRTITVTGATVNHPPVGTITAPAANVSITAGQSVSFTGTATDPDGNQVTVLWAFGDGATSTLLAPGAHTYAAAGTFTVTFTATDSLGLADPNPPTRTITVTPVAVNAPPTGTITAPAGDVTITAGQSVTFAGTATDPNNDPVTVLWAFGDGATSTQLSPGAHVYATAGTFTVRFTATDSHGLADPAPPTRTITVNPVSNPAPTLTQLQTTIFTPLCTSCHDAAGAAGMNLTAGNAFANLVNVPATTLPGLRVVPGSPSTSALVIQLQNGHRSVSAANQSLISAWITAGALNN